jgi:ribosome-associated protein
MKTDLQIFDDEKLIFTIPSGELRFTASTSSGPGGQHVNKVSSRVTLFWNISETAVLTAWQRTRITQKLSSRISKEGVLSLSVDDHRSQHRNKEAARQRLASLIVNSLATVKPRIPTKTTKGAVKRRLADKKKRSQSKQLRKNISHSDY